MQNLSVEEHRERLENIKRATASVRSCVRELRIHDYIPGQVIYYLGDYPAPMNITPTEYDYELLKLYAERGFGLIQVHEEWNDTIEKYGSDKWNSCDKEGMKKFIELCHEFGIKIIPYCSSSYIHGGSASFTEKFCRSDYGCADMHYAYRVAHAGSEYWRNFIIPRAFHIMDEYGFDGLFNDWGYDWHNSHIIPISKEKRSIDYPVEGYDLEAEDLIHTLYDGVKARGGIYKLHVGRNEKAPVRGRHYDYLWIGEGKFGAEYGAGKMYEPFVVPCPDKPRLTKYGETRFDADEYFAMTIPFVQFPLLTHGRPTMGKCIDVPGVKQYHTKDPNRLYHYFEQVRDFVNKHPNGPYVYSEWSQIPDDPEDFDKWSHYLELYKPMVIDETVVHMEIRDCLSIMSDIPEQVYITMFSNMGQYMVVSNMTEELYRLELKGIWKNRETDEVGTDFVVPAKRLLFLVRNSFCIDSE